MIVILPIKGSPMVIEALSPNSKRKMCPNIPENVKLMVGRSLSISLNASLHSVTFLVFNTSKNMH